MTQGELRGVAYRFRHCVLWPPAGVQTCCCLKLNRMEMSAAAFALQSLLPDIRDFAYYVFCVFGRISGTPWNQTLMLSSVATVVCVYVCDSCLTCGPPTTTLIHKLSRYFMECIFLWQRTVYSANTVCQIFLHVFTSKNYSRSSIDVYSKMLNFVSDVF